jgi:hypothetical protein
LPAPAARWVAACDDRLAARAFILKPVVAMTAGYLTCPVLRAAVGTFKNVIHFENFRRSTLVQYILLPSGL